MGKKSRRIRNKQITYRTLEERTNEINTLKPKIESLGLSSSFNGIDELYLIMDKFIKDGQSVSGTIRGRDQIPAQSTRRA